MNAVNAVLLFILVWTFTAVCQVDKEFSVSCEKVTGFVRKEVNLTCSVTVLKTDCCITMYKFLYPERVNDSAICRQELPDDSCDQRHIFTCSYTPATAMTQQFRFFVQAPRGTEKSEFTVSIAETLKKDDKPEDGSKNHGPNNPVIPTAVGLSVIFIIIIILMAIIYKKQSCGFQNRMLLCIKHDNDNSNHPEDVI